MNGSGEHTLADTDRDGYSSIKDALEKNNYKTDTISLIEKPEIPKTCTIVVVGGPKHDYLQPAMDALKIYVMGGGRAIFNFDPVLNLPNQKMGDTPALGHARFRMGRHAEWRRDSGSEFGRAGCSGSFRPWSDLTNSIRSCA